MQRFELETPRAKSKPNLKKTALIAGGIIAIALGVRGLLKEFLSENESLAMPTEITGGLKREKSQSVYIPKPPKITRKSNNKPDAGDHSPDAAGHINVLFQKCTELESTTEASQVYDALVALSKIVNPDEGAYDMGIYTLRKFASACNLSMEQIMLVLKLAIDDGDTRIAGVVNQELQRRCSEENMARVASRDYVQEHQALTDCLDKEWKSPRDACVFDDQVADKSDCADLSQTSPRTECLNNLKHAQDEQNILEQELKRNCPDRLAAEMGLDGQRVQALDAEPHASYLLSLKMDLLNPEVEPNDKMMMDYAMHMKTTLVFTNNMQVIRALGIASVAEFRAEYVEKVAERLNKTGHARYAEFVRKLWMLRSLLSNDE